MILDTIRQANQGRKILADWLGEGAEPVPLAQAQARANICLSCPLNYQGSWLWQMSTALAIASQMQLRNLMKLELTGEEKLMVCESCGCQLKLKVHVPFQHLYRHTSPETFANYPDHCWQKREFNQMPKP